jgi:hypothetical protein
MCVCVGLNLNIVENGTDKKKRTMTWFGLELFMIIRDSASPVTTVPIKWTLILLTQPLWPKFRRPSLCVGHVGVGGEMSVFASSVPKLEESSLTIRNGLLYCVPLWYKFSTHNRTRMTTKPSYVDFPRT